MKVWGAGKQIGKLFQASAALFHGEHGQFKRKKHGMAVKHPAPEAHACEIILLVSFPEQQSTNKVMTSTNRKVCSNCPSLVMLPFFPLLAF